MIIVKNAGALQGYSSTDHLIDSSACLELVGRQFRSVAQALKAADKRCKMERPGHGYTSHPYTFVEVLFADGSTRWFSSV